MITAIRNHLSVVLAVSAAVFAGFAFINALRLDAAQQEVDKLETVSYTHLTLPTTPYV